VESHAVGTLAAEPELGRYLLELVPDKNGFEDIRALTERSRAACDELALEHVVVRLIRSIFMPEDGTCLLVFDAASAPAIAETARRASLPASRLSVLLSLPEAVASAS
jgi:hypothetical protein